MVATFVPDRGDLVWIDLDPQAGHEQAGRRPAIVLSPKIYNQRTGLAIVCPITNQRKGYLVEVSLPPGLGITGVVLSDHVKSLDWKARRITRIGKAPAEVLDAIADRLLPLISSED